MISRRRFARLLSHGMVAPLALTNAAHGAPIFAAAATAGDSARTGRARRLLLFTKSAGYEHDVVRSNDGNPSIVDTAVSAMGKRMGYEVTTTKDGERFAEEMRTHDAVLFFTSGDLTTRGTDSTPPMPASAKDALLVAIENGLGFVGVHSASDTFHGTTNTIDPFIAMLGGEFESHGRPQRASLSVVDPAFPGMPRGARLERHGEWYAFRNLDADVHALLMLETATMEGDDYRRPSYPVVWAKRSGRGRVFYTALGHFAEEWQDADFLQMLEGGIRWAAGDVAADVSPNRQG